MLGGGVKEQNLPGPAPIGLTCTVYWVDAGDRPSGVRLAELVAALSLAVC